MEGETKKLKEMPIEKLGELIERVIDREREKRLLNMEKLLDKIHKNYEEEMAEEEEKEKEEEIKNRAIHNIAEKIMKIYPKGILSLIEEENPKEDDVHLLMVMNCTPNFYETYSEVQQSSSEVKHATKLMYSKAEPKRKSATLSKEETKKRDSSADSTKRSATLTKKLSVLDDEPKVELTKNAMAEFHVKDLSEAMSKTEKYRLLVKQVFQDMDKYEDQLLSHVVEHQAKLNSEKLKTKDPEKYKNLEYYESIMKKPYHEFHFEDFILIIFRMIKFFTDLKIKMEISEGHKIFIRIFGNEKIYESLAENFDYVMQLKPYAYKYDIYVKWLMKKQEKEKLEKLEKSSSPTFLEGNENDQLCVKEDIKFPVLQFEDLDMDNPKHWPPYTPYDLRHEIKYARYEKNDLNHDCPWDPEFEEFWTEEELASKKKKCCSKFRGIDKLRLIHRTIDSLMKFSLLSTIELLDSVSFKRDFISYGELLTLEHVVWNPANIFSYFKQMKFISLARNFYGEKISFFFLWNLHYNKWLLFPAILGIVTFIICSSAKNAMDAAEFNTFKGFKLNYYDITLFVFCFLITIWATLFLKIWKQKEKLFSYFWGMENYQLNEPNQENFVPDERLEFIFDQNLQIPSKIKKWFKSAVSYFVLALMAGLTAVFCYLLFDLKAKMTNYGKDEDLTWPMIVAVINAVQIRVMSVIYEFIARHLTNWENHEKQSQRENALSIKLIIFEFVNNYIAVYYIAFIKPYTREECLSKNCLKEIEVQLYIILLMIFGFNILEVGFPIIKYRWRLRKMRQQMRDAGENDQIEVVPHSHVHQMLCDPMDTLIYDYNEMVIMFGYVCFFGVAAPLTPLIILVLSFIEKFVDSYKIFFTQRVTIIEGSSGIEIYNVILKVFYFIGMLTNIGLVLFTNPHLTNQEAYKQGLSDLQDNTDFIIKFIIFAILENIILIMIKFMDYNIIPRCIYFYNI
jgi:hypothetical protein